MDNSQIIQLINNNTDEIYEFETVPSFFGTDSSTITSYATSEGTSYTDNIYKNPSTFNCSINISGSANISDEWGDGADRPKTAFSMLSNWKLYGTPFTIITPQKDYFNMFVTNISPSNTTSNAYNFSASLTFTELFIATYQIETVGPFYTEEDVAEDSSDDSSVSVLGVAGAVVVGVLSTPVLGLFSAIGLAAYLINKWS